MNKFKIIILLTLLYSVSYAQGIEFDPVSFCKDSNLDAQKVCREGIPHWLYESSLGVVTVVPADTTQVDNWCPDCCNTVAVGGEVTLDTILMPLYEERWVIAEENGVLNANSAEWSYGNGATGYMGEVVDEGWEVVAMYLMADTYAATASVQVDLMNYGNTPSNAAANTISSISLTNSTDGGGATNNAYKYFQLPAPIPVPVTGTTTVLGFLTRNVSGTISDVRVGAKIRKLKGYYISNIVVSP